MAPYITLHNSTEEDSDGGRECRLIAKGEQSGGEETTLGYIEISHDGAADDQKGQLRIYLNDGSDGDAPTLVFTIDSAGAITTTNGWTGTFTNGDGDTVTVTSGIITGVA